MKVAFSFDFSILIFHIGLLIHMTSDKMKKNILIKIIHSESSCLILLKLNLIRMPLN